jgi:hypothetical protein
MTFLLQWLCVAYFTMLAIYLGSTPQAGGIVGIGIAYAATVLYVRASDLLARYWR